MPSTHIASGRAFTYTTNIGKISRSETGFRHPVGLARGKNDTLYIANWGDEASPNARITKCSIPSQDWIDDIGAPGNGPGEFLWPGGLASDSAGHLYVTDQADHKVVIFQSDGQFVEKWGSYGTKAGEFNSPAGIAVDSKENLWIVDSRNHRIQKHAKDGKYLQGFGRFGSELGALNNPWGIGLDGEDNVYVADWGNNRIQKFSPDGDLLLSIAHANTSRDPLNHPSDVTIDPDGDIYIADWGNHRVAIYEPDGTFLLTIKGDASNLSSWAKSLIAANPDLAKARSRVDLEPEWRFWHPVSIHIGADYKILIAEAQHMRIQIYQKDLEYTEAQFTL
jgi:DNA-binding beta-propeller fold protein YncE